MFANCCQTQFPQIYNCNFRKNFSYLLNDRSIVQITNYLWKSKKPSVRSRQNSRAYAPAKPDNDKKQMSTKPDKT